MAKFDRLHPALDDARLDDWRLMRDCYDGERVVKGRRAVYLPVTSGQYALGMGTGTNGRTRPGQLLYDAYLARAAFPEIVHQTISALVGIMVREPWSITLPDQMDYMHTRATVRGEPLATLIDRMLAQILLTGRVGLMLDVRAAENELYIADYQAHQIINWDDNPIGDLSTRRLRLVVLNESRAERVPGNLGWKAVTIYRALTIGGVAALDSPLGVAYTVEIERDDGNTSSVVPMLRGRSLGFVPFTFCNTSDLVPDPGEIPLIGLARLAMTIYRGEADYRQSLFMQGQDTLVLRGVANPDAQDVSMSVDGHVPYGGPPQTGSKVVVGAGAVIYLPDPEMSAEFIGVSSTGIAEQRQAIENDHRRAEQLGMALLTSGNQGEAAETLQTRVTARTASLASIARAAGAAIRQQLQWAAQWHGADPESVVVEPNIDFIAARMAASEINEMITAKVRGFPMSWRSMHRLAEQGDLTMLGFEEELEEIAAEPQIELITGVGEDGDQ